MKLKKILNVFHKKDLTAVAKQEQADFAILRNYITRVFMTNHHYNLTQSEYDYLQGLNDYAIAHIRRDDDRPQHIYKEEYLPYHTRDDVWLAKYLNHIIKDLAGKNRFYAKQCFKTYQNLVKNSKLLGNQEFNQDPKNEYNEFILVNSEKHTKIPFETILKFVQHDTEFDTARTAYEVDLTRAQIDYMMRNGNPNEVLMHHRYQRTEPHTVRVFYRPAIARFRKNTDKSFRHAVYLGLTKNLGLDQHSVEIGLEKHADLWREQTMCDAFYNEYALKEEEIAAIDKNACFYDAMLEKFRDDWVHAREYQYYQEHQAIIDEVGNATPFMKMDDKALTLLNQRLTAFEERYQSIREMAHNKQNFSTAKEM